MVYANELVLRANLYTAVSSTSVFPHQRRLTAPLAVTRLATIAVVRLACCPPRCTLCPAFRSTKAGQPTLPPDVPSESFSFASSAAPAHLFALQTKSTPVGSIKLLPSLEYSHYQPQEFACNRTGSRSCLFSLSTSALSDNFLLSVAWAQAQSIKEELKSNLYSGRPSTDEQARFDSSWQLASASAFAR